MTLSYDDIFSRFLGYITDYDIVSVNPDDAYSQMREWLRKAYSKPYLNRLFSSSVLDDEIQTLTFEMSFKVNDDSDKEFVIEILSKGMVIEWLQPQVKNKLLTQQMFGGKEQKLRELVALTVRCIWKHYSVFLRICWKPLRVLTLQHKDEICLSVIV